MDKITLEYNVFDLPTAQHRAGLAGFLFLHKYLKGIDAEPLPEITISKKEYDVSIEITEENLQTMFKELYHANCKDTKGEASGFALEQYGLPDNWLKNWKTAVNVAIIGTYKGEYKLFCKKDKQKEATDMYRYLSGASKEKKRFNLKKQIYIGSMTNNEENVPFTNKLKDKLLLYFWQQVMQVYQIQDPEIAKKPDRKKNFECVIVIPDVFQPKRFVEKYISFLYSLKKKNRYQDTVLSLPSEGGLEFLHSFFNILQINEKRTFGSTIRGSEIYHLKKEGKNTKILQHNRIFYNDWFYIASKYDQLRMKESLILRKLIIENLLLKRNWFTNFEKLMSLKDIKYFFFIPAGERKNENKSAKNEAQKFQRSLNSLFNKNKTKGEGMKEYQERLPDLVLRMVRKYVLPPKSQAQFS